MAGTAPYESGKKGWGSNQRYTIPNGCNGEKIRPLCPGSYTLTAYAIFFFTRVFSTAFTADARFVLSGSDDGNVRIWKARASDKLGVIDARERAAMEYRDSLKERWKMDAEVGRVAR